MTAIEDDLARALEANGITATAPDGMHSWRCEYPDVYGPCDCLAELMADLAPIVAAHVAAGQERWTDWLANTAFGIDYWTPDSAPPCTIDELAAAYHRHDPSETAETWRWTVEAETDPFDRAATYTRTKENDHG